MVSVLELTINHRWRMFNLTNFGNIMSNHSTQFIASTFSNGQMKTSIKPMTNLDVDKCQQLPAYQIYRGNYVLAKGRTTIYQIVSASLYDPTIVILSYKNECGREQLFHLPLSRLRKVPFGWLDGYPVYYGTQLITADGYKFVVNKYASGMFNDSIDVKMVQFPNNNPNFTNLSLGDNVRIAGVDAVYAGMSISSIDPPKPVHLVMWRDSFCYNTNNNYDDAVEWAAQVCPSTNSHIPTLHQTVTLVNNIESQIPKSPNYWKYYTSTKTKQYAAIYCFNLYTGEFGIQRIELNQSNTMSLAVSEFE